MFLCVLLLTPALATAEETAAPPFKTTGAFFALSVADLEASRQWYADTLGLRVVLQPPPYEGITTVVLEGGGLIVELMRHPASVPARSAAPALTHPGPIHGYFKAGIVVDDFEAALAGLRKRGVRIVVGPFPAGNGQRANVMIQDNAGNLIQFFGR
jgi:catechol 2,3-dioxygenase-like lactoylglutathione lyase family enzyme